jgi:WD40 repeat protein
MRTWTKWTLGVAAAVAAVAALRVAAAFLRRDGPAPLPPVALHGGDAFGDPLPEGAVARFGTIRWRARGPAVWAPDGEHLLVGGWDDEILAMNAKTGLVDWTLPGHAGRIAMNIDVRDIPRIVQTGELPTAFDSLAEMHLMPDGHRLLTAGRSLRIWNLDTRTEEKRFPIHSDAWPVAVSPDGTLAACSWNHFVRVIDLTTGARRVRVDTEGNPTCVAFDSDGSHVLAGLEDGRIAIGRLADRPPVFVRVSDKCIVRLLVPGDGRDVWALDQNGAVAIVPLASPETPPRRIAVADPNPKVCCAVAMTSSPDGRTVAVSRSDQPIRWFDAATASPVAGPTVEPGLVAIGWSPDGRTFAAARYSGVPMFFDRVALSLHGSGAPAPPDAADDPVGVVAFSPDETRVAACSGRTLRISAVATGATVTKFASDVEIRSAAWTKDGAVVLGVQGPRIVAVDAATAAVRWTYDADPATKPVPWSMRIGAGGESATWIGGDGAVRVLDLRGDRTAGPVAATATNDVGHFPQSWALSADGRRLAALQLVRRQREARPDTEQWTLRVWESDSTEPRAEADAPGRSTFALSRDGRLAVVESTVFDLAASPPREIGRVSWTSRERECRINIESMAAFSTDATLLAYGDDDGAIHLFAIPSCSEISTLRGHRAAVLCVAFSPDGKSLVSGSADTTALVWDLRHLAAAPPSPAAK